MTAANDPDSAEEALAEQVGDVVPGFGRDRIPVVGLGGSAGSIEALQEFFSAIPPDTGMACLIVIHLSADHQSVLADVVQRSARMNVQRVHGPLRMQANTVYVIPPGKTPQVHLSRSA